MATLAQAIAGTARSLLKDKTGNPFGTRFDDSFFLDAVNDGQLEIVGLKYDAHTENVAHELVAGTRQPLPSDAVAFLRLNRNLGLDGSTPGRTITSTTKADLDSSDPYWHQARDIGEAIHYVFDDISEKYFYVYPATTGFVELVYSQVPARLTDLAQPITLLDIYAPSLIYYLVYRAYSVDMDDVVMQGKAQEFYSLFANSIGTKIQNELATSPNEAPQ